MAIAAQLERLVEIKPQLSDNVRAAIDAGRATMDRAMGPGAGEIVAKVTLNIGTISGGVKVNMVPSSATFEPDIRLPLGVTRERVLAEVAMIMEAFPEATVRETNCNLPSWVDPDCEIIRIVQKKSSSCAVSSRSQSSVWVAPTPGYGVIVIFRPACTAPSRTAWGLLTSMSISRTSCTLCALTRCRPSTSFPPETPSP